MKPEQKCFAIIYGLYVRIPGFDRCRPSGLIPVDVADYKAVSSCNGCLARSLVEWGMLMNPSKRGFPMSGKLRVASIFAAALALAAASATPAAAQGGVKVGTLTCNVSGAWGFIFGSTRTLACTFVGAGGRVEYYSGQINRFGVDIGYTQGGVLIWTVFAPTANLAPGALAGTYAGGTASATVGVGVGANALIGGSGNTVSLQPLSLEANRGLNVAAGIAGMTLTPAR
jgi:hypothetical protein